MIGVVIHVTDHCSCEWILERVIYNARELGATHILAVDHTQYHSLDYYDHSDEATTFLKYTSLEDIEAAFPGATWVYLEAQQTILDCGGTPVAINDFDHPEEDVIYCTGPDFGPSIATEGRAGASWVYIGCDTLWGQCAAELALFDRLTYG